MSEEQTLSAFAAELEARARSAGSVAELCFSMANDAHPLLGFRQALVLGEGGRVLTVSGLAKPEEDSPYLLWLRCSWPWVRECLPAGGWFAPSDEVLAGAPADVADGWREWWPAGVCVLRLSRRNGQPLGWVLFLLEQPPAPEAAALLTRVSQTWAYCWEMLAGVHRPSLRQTALAPGEVVPLEAVAITAALDGVVSTVHVRPNQVVQAGDPLFSLDDTTLRNRLEVVRQSVAVADAELLSATQMSFDDSRSKAELAALIGRTQERRAELAAVQAQLERVHALAPYDGIAVFADADEWQGRPVMTGERIMLLADPAKSAMLVHLPVADAIALEVGAPVKLFLTVRPLSPLKGRVTETSYQATLSPEGVASYRLRADLDGNDARIGLKGTAKLYGGWVVLGYYLLRRPLATLREWSGW